VLTELPQQIPRQDASESADQTDYYMYPTSTSAASDATNGYQELELSGC